MDKDALIENEIVQIENEILSAIKRKDPGKLHQLLADDFVYRNPVEGDRSRAAFLAAVESLPVQILSVWSEDLKVNVFGAVAVASGRQNAKTLNEDGDEEMSASAFVDVFVKQQEQWRLAWAHGVDVTREKP